MLALKPIARNMSEVQIGSAIVLFSYQTPVACHIEGKGYFRTSKRWSATTTRHINKWLAKMRPIDPVQERDQSFFNGLVA